MEKQILGKRPQPMHFFLHVPKAGGTTLMECVSQMLPSDPKIEVPAGWLLGEIFYYPINYVQEDVDRATRESIKEIAARHSISCVIGHFTFGAHELFNRESTYVTLLRSPLQRVVSLFSFHQLVQSKRGALDGVRLPSDMTLEEFLENPPYRDVCNGQTRRIAGNLQCEESRPLLEKAKSNLRSHFSVVGLTEKFDESLLLLAREFGIEDPPIYYPKNVNPNRLPLDELPEETVKLLERRNELDLELYAFALELFETQVEAYGGDFNRDLEKFRVRRSSWLKSKSLGS